MNMDHFKHDHLFVFSGANKAGMNEIDKELQSKVIYNMSKDSAFFKNAQQRDSKTDEKIQSLKRKMEELDKDAVKLDEFKSLSIDDIAKCELQRNLSRICCVMDMDMFFAAVEIRDQPDLADKPVAVGGNSMICTANYVARKYGVRSAMPGFIAKKLCPQLIFIPPNFEKYTTVSNIIKRIVSEYDPYFRSMSLDEVYFDITNYCSQKLQSSFSSCHVSYDMPSSLPMETLYDVAEEVMNEIRLRITMDTKGLTASAGIGPNFLLAKIAADINKPNGQHIIPPIITQIYSFINDLPIRKIPGIGKVMERLLKSLRIETVLNIRESLYYLKYIFSPIQYDYFLHVSLGLDGWIERINNNNSSHTNNSTRNTEQTSAKSLGASRTFQPTSNKELLLEKLHMISEIVGSEMTQKDYYGKTVTIKVKYATFEEYTRRKTFGKAIQTTDDIYKIALQILSDPWPEVKIRLLGVTMSNFVTAPKHYFNAENKYFKILESPSQLQQQNHQQQQQQQQQEVSPCDVAHDYYRGEVSTIARCEDDGDDNNNDDINNNEEEEAMCVYGGWDVSAAGIAEGRSREVSPGAVADIGRNTLQDRCDSAHVLSSVGEIKTETKEENKSQVKGGEGYTSQLNERPETSRLITITTTTTTAAAAAAAAVMASTPATTTITSPLNSSIARASKPTLSSPTLHLKNSNIRSYLLSNVSQNRNENKTRRDLSTQSHQLVNNSELKSSELSGLLEHLIGDSEVISTVMPEILHSACPVCFESITGTETELTSHVNRCLEQISNAHIKPSTATTATISSSSSSSFSGMNSGTVLRNDNQHNQQTNNQVKNPTYPGNKMMVAATTTSRKRKSLQMNVDSFFGGEKLS